MTFTRSRVRPASAPPNLSTAATRTRLARPAVEPGRRLLGARIAKRAGAIVHGGPSARTTVVVRGRPNPLQAAGRDAGLKLMEIKRLRDKGHRTKLLNETLFWRLAGSRARTS